MATAAQTLAATCLARWFESVTLIVTLRTGRPADLAAVDALLARSYPRLLGADYPPSVMVLAVPIISRARPELLASGRYYLAFGARDQLLGAGGWSTGAPVPTAQPDWRAGHERVGHIRHVATDAGAVRQGVGRQVMSAIFVAAREQGVTQLHCLSTRTAVPFYESLGFRAIGPVVVPLRPGIVFPAVKMLCDLQ